MTLTTLSACMAATLSLCVAQAPSQPRDIHDMKLNAISGYGGASTSAKTPTGAKIILAHISRG